MNLLQDKYQDLCDIGREWKLPASHRTIDEWIGVAENLAREHGGSLPSRKWLDGNGYCGLRRMIRMHPERFTHIKQEKLRKTVEEYVVDAENLARDHGGVLPMQKWLIGNGYSDLASVICRCPERLAHIKQEKFFKTIEERIAEAENLAKEHGGAMPNRRWLEKNGYNGLRGMIDRHPERFAHIKRMIRNKVL